MDHLGRSLRNRFGLTGLDRVGARRADPDWVNERMDHAHARFVLVWRERSLVAAGDAMAPVFLAREELPDTADPADSVLLGDQDGRTYFALDVRADEDQIQGWLPPSASFAELRDMGGLLPPSEAGLLAYARAMTYWHARHRYCGVCGAATASRDGGHARDCTACGARHFPRTDPAIIVLVTDTGTGVERCLLGRPAAWPAGLYSTIAGFVEPGESIEAAVVREVWEETGIEVDRAHYHSSQPWPFPSSLMLGFTANAASRDIARHDGELEDARWFSRAELIEAVASGAVRLPRRLSIAYRLVEDWFDDGQVRTLAAQLEEAAR